MMLEASTKILDGEENINLLQGIDFDSQVEMSEGHSLTAWPKGTNVRMHYNKPICQFYQIPSFNLVKIEPTSTIKEGMCYLRIQLDMDSSTFREERMRDLKGEINKLFILAFEAEFEDGMESQFSNALLTFIRKYSNDAIETLAPIFINERINSEIISEALRWIGRFDHESTHSMRLWLLERCLFCLSPQIRDSAALGLEEMNDPTATVSLRHAIDRETISELREDMKHVLSDIESNVDGISP